MPQSTSIYKEILEARVIYDDLRMETHCFCGIGAQDFNLFI